jgi:hypothetical protein
MSYPIITLHAFQQFIADHRDSGVIPNKPEPTFRGSGDDSFSKIKQPISGILDSWKKQIKTIGDSSAKKEALEAELSEQLFKVVSPLPMNALTDSDFWRFLACHYFFEFIEWRDGESCALASFGANANRVNFDCVPYRMFNRALVASSLTEKEDDFKYVHVPGTDLWRSHILRVKNSFSRAMTQAILDKSLAKELPTQILRETAKNLKRLRNNNLFESLEHEDAMTLLEAEIGKFKKKEKK